MKALFGYGSLILPMSTVGRFDEELGKKTKEIRENGGGPGEFLDFYLEEDIAERKWKGSNIHFIPVKIYGLKRYYSLEIYEDGNMLVAEEGSEDYYINGVIIYPLNDRRMEKISETEEEYRLLEKSREDIESYIPEEKLREKGLELPDTVSVYVGQEGIDEINRDTERKRLDPYHRYPFEGIKLIAERLLDSEESQKELVEEFSEDFNKTTFEVNDKGKWMRISEK